MRAAGTSCGGNETHLKEKLLMCRSLAASATTLTAPLVTVPDLDKPPPSHIAISHSSGGALSAGGHEFLTGMDKTIFLSERCTSSGALVLGMDAGSNTSLSEVTLGQLTCRRLAGSPRFLSKTLSTMVKSQHCNGVSQFCR